MTYHKPVMLDECIEGLKIKPDGIYIDVTFGGGGHAKEILNKLTTGTLYGFDQDEDAKVNANALACDNLVFIQANFRDMKSHLKMHGVQEVDGILADLGVSSHQFDVPERGFSTRFDAELDMRMDQEGTLTARKILNEYSERDLHRLFGVYGEVRNAKTLAAAIVSERVSGELKTVKDLKTILNRYAKRGKENKYYAQVFQALRIEANDEMKALEDFLLQSVMVLKEGGRLVVMSYHSLEDRMVKNFMNMGKAKGEVEKDFYGNILRPLEVETRKPMVATANEIEINNRARSAKLRIAVKK